jgi:hypothetical protein
MSKVPAFPAWRDFEETFRAGFRQFWWEPEIEKYAILQLQLLYERFELGKHVSPEDLTEHYRGLCLKLISEILLLQVMLKRLGVRDRRPPK